MYKSEYLNCLLEKVKKQYQNEIEFIQAVEEFFDSMDILLEKHPEIVDTQVIDRIIYPERVFEFRIPWVNDQNKIEVNTGYRVQFNSAIGPYKGGMRFDKSVNLSILKFLGFEQTFKNSLTGLPMGGGKGGADFDPIGKSDGEIMRFCQAFMSELYHFIGPDMDVPAGDLGFGAREVGYMYGMLKKLTHLHQGSFTGKGISFGGSLGRTEATGYGVCYFAEEMLKTYLNTSFKDKKVIISGCGKVARYAIKKAWSLGAKIIGVSDRYGCIIDENGLDVDYIFNISANTGCCSKEYHEKYPTAFYSTNVKDLWNTKHQVDIIMPCATQGEINLEDAKSIKENGCFMLVEGANMPVDLPAIRYFNESGIIFAPGKAANAGGVAVSGLEMSQNAMHLSWTFEEVDEKLQGIMKDIFKKCYEISKEYNQPKNLAMGANIAGFLKVFDAMKQEGVI